MAILKLKQTKRRDDSLGKNMKPIYETGFRNVYRVTEVEDSILWKIDDFLEEEHVSEIIRLKIAKVIIK